MHFIITQLALLYLIGYLGLMNLILDYFLTLYFLQNRLALPYQKYIRSPHRLPKAPGQPTREPQNWSHQVQ